ncbi:MAG: hypothetical protein HC935_11215, partial [Pseudanabaena sp. SU_2_4]|nr:hypothetical protein [Pseudanabaena sp. SU_2_4]
AAATPNSISLQPHAIPPIQQQHSGQLGARAYQLVSMQYEQQLERIRQLIKAAIAYFFGKKPNVTPLDTVVEVRSQPWLTMADLFDDDSGHWPAIAQDKTGRREVSPWESPQFDGINTAQSKSLKAVPNTALARNPNRNLTQNKYAGITSTASSDPLAGAIARESEHTTSEIVPDLSCWLDDSFDIEIEERSRPLQAWIETQATFLGYVYSPIMEFIHCLDRLMAKFEQWLVQLWQKIWNKLRGDV